MKTLKTIIAVKTIKGTSFVGVRGYENKQGEVSNQTFLVGINYENLLTNDLAKLKALDVSKIKSTFDIELLKEAKQAEILSLEKRLSTEAEKAKLLAKGDKTIVASEAQKAAYINIAKGLKAQDEAIFIFGLCVNKTILKSGEYKTVNSRPLTLAKKQVKKSADLSILKYKSFKLGNKEELNLQGVTI